MPMPPIDPRFNAFYMLTGVTFVTFASGFGVCMFNLDTVDACVEVADSWVIVFKQMGDHLLAWAYSMALAIFE